MKLSAWARKLGISRSTLGRRLSVGWTLSKALSAPRQPPGRRPDPKKKLSDAQIEEIRRLRKLGASTGRIAKLFGVSRKHVSKVVRLLTRKPRAPQPPPGPALLVELIPGLDGVPVRLAPVPPSSPLSAFEPSGSISADAFQESA